MSFSILKLVWIEQNHVIYFIFQARRGCTVWLTNPKFFSDVVTIIYPKVISILSL